MSARIGQQPGADGDGERRDQAEQHLEQALRRIEVAADEAADHGALSPERRARASDRVK